jgi:predicted acylesterase/phospholipase RssA
VSDEAHHCANPALNEAPELHEAQRCFTLSLLERPPIRCAARREQSFMTEALSRLLAAKRPGFLFSGGAARCVFQIGVVEALDSLGIRPAACLGVSAGVWNAAAVAVGNARRLRPYWRFFCRMPAVDLTNLAREHSPFIWSRLHQRAFARYVGADRIKAADTIPLYAALTRRRDRQSVVVDVREFDDPFRALLASNYLPPFYTHPPMFDGEKYLDGGFSDNTPYEHLFERGCDMVVLMASKGESEGGLHRNVHDHDHEISEPFRGRVVVIRPRHRMPLGFVERRWARLAPMADLGALRAREVLFGEWHPQCDIAARGRAPSAYFTSLRTWMKRREAR